MPVVGLLSGTDREASPLDAIWQGLKEADYVEGRNVAMEYRWAEGQLDSRHAAAASSNVRLSRPDEAHRLA